MHPTAVLLLTALLASTPAAAIDLHAYWDQRCAGCHGHSADFARRSLTVEQGRLKGSHHRDDLARFLGNHYVSDGLVEPVMQMLASQAVQAPTFRDRCASCHGSASAFARQSLEWRDGVLWGRKSGKAVGAYLATHGGLPAAEIPEMVDALTRVRREVAP